MLGNIKNSLKYAKILDKKTTALIMSLYSSVLNKSKVELVDLKKSEIRVYVDGYSLEKLYVDYEIFNKIRKKIKDQLVIDIGANIGYFSLLMAYNGNTTYAIEPSQEAMPIMVQNLNKNPDIRDNIVTKNIAIYNKTDYLQFIDHYKKGLRIKGKILETELLEYSSSYPVKALEVNEFLANFEKINLLRINIGGFEDRVFDAMSRETLARIDTLIVDVHRSCKDFAFVERLKKNFDNWKVLYLTKAFSTYCFFRSRIF